MVSIIRKIQRVGATSLRWLWPAGERPDGRRWRFAMIALVGVAGALLLSLGLAFGRDQRRPGSMPPADAPDGFQLLGSITGREDASLAIPLAVAIGPRGQIYVADAGNRVVQVFDAGGGWQRTLGHGVEMDAEPGDLIYPTGLTLDADGNLYVTDITAGHVSIFSPLGTFLRYFAEDSPGKKPFVIPAGILYRDGLFYLNDVGSHRVRVLRQDGSIVRVLGSGKGVELKQMLYPNYTAVGPDGRVYVADSNNNRVQIFGADGEFERALVSGHPDSGVSVLRGIAIDDLGRLHVASTMEHRVLVFDGDGNLLFAYGEEGSGAAQLGFPNGVTIAGDQVYVADRANQRIQIWKLGSLKRARP